MKPGDRVAHPVLAHWTGVVVTDVYLSGRHGVDESVPCVVVEWSADGDVIRRLPHPVELLELLLDDGTVRPPPHHELERNDFEEVDGVVQRRYPGGPTMSPKVCPQCGCPAKVVVVHKTRVRCELRPNNTLGRVLSVSRKGDQVVEFECGGGHTWEDPMWVEER